MRFEGGGRYKVLILIKGLGLGGAERLIADAIPFLDREVFDYEFAFLVPKKDFLVSVIRKEGFPVHCLQAAGAGSFLRAFGRLWCLQRQKKYDLIHAHLPAAGILARLVGFLLRVPVFYTEHNLQERYHALTRLLNKLTYGINRHVIAVSDHVMGSIRRTMPGGTGAVSTIKNSVPVCALAGELTGLQALRDDLGIPKNHRVVGTVAVFRRQKALLDWIDIAAQVMTERDNVTFLLVGHGPMKKELEAKIKAIGLSGRLVMPGFRADGRKVMGLMDIYLMSSQYEGLPLALLEAMAARLPVVATTVGGIPEVIREGREGFLVPFKDTAKAACAVKRLLDDEKVRIEMGARAFARVSTAFNLKDHVKKVEDLYIKELRKDAA